jgi:putative acetyltransferase
VVNRQDIETRYELPEDWNAIRDIHLCALGEGEARLVDLLRRRGDVIGLVAVAGGRVVGHIMFSPMTVEQAPEGFRAIGLAPLSVLPEFQKQGIGSKLVKAGLQACRGYGYDVMFVLGHTAYYPRFGFSRASDNGIENEYNAGDSFMVIELKQGVLPLISGMAKYAPEFREADV